MSYLQYVNSYNNVSGSLQFNAVGRFHEISTEEDSAKIVRWNFRSVGGPGTPKNIRKKTRCTYSIRQDSFQMISSQHHKFVIQLLVLGLSMSNPHDNKKH